jgi:hypothetical protein
MLYREPALSQYRRTSFLKTIIIWHLSHHWHRSICHFFKIQRNKGLSTHRHFQYAARVRIVTISAHKLFSNFGICHNTATQAFFIRIYSICHISATQSSACVGYMKTCTVLEPSPHLQFLSLPPPPPTPPPNSPI